MSIYCLLHGHDYVKIEEVWVNNAEDEYHSTNIGGLVKSESHDVLRCIRCSKKKKVFNGKIKFV